MLTPAVHCPQKHKEKEKEKKKREEEEAAQVYADFVESFEVPNLGSKSAMPHLDNGAEGGLI